MTWLDVGNGWRNLFLLSCAVQAVALGALFAARRWPLRKSRAADFLFGVAATPFVEYLFMLLLALVWPGAPRMVYIGALPALAALCLITLCLRRLRRLPALLRRGGRFLRRVCRFQKPALMALCFALCLIILLAPVCVRFLSSMNSVLGGDAGGYMGQALRYCENRDLSQMLEKDDPTGHYRGNSHFPSLELYMSYGLFHAGGELGYPYDKPAFTGLGLLTFYLLAAYLALLLHFCRERKGWVLLGVLLFNLVPGLFDSVSSAPRDIWRILALLLAALVFAGLEPRGSWKRYLGRVALAFAVCFTVMSAHVVCFVVLPFLVAAWVVWRWLEALARRDHTAGRTLLASLGVALSGAAGTVVAFLGNLWCYRTWGEMSPWRLMTTYTTAPWYADYMAMEYKLEETTTRLNFWQAKSDIMLGYATPVGVWGWRLSLLALLCVAVWLVVRRGKARAGVCENERANGRVNEREADNGGAATLTGACANGRVNESEAGNGGATTLTGARANGRVNEREAGNGGATALTDACMDANTSACANEREARSASEATALPRRTNEKACACQSARIASAVTLCALFTLFTLAPMTGLLDTKLYSFSGSFLKMLRYTLHWFILCNVMICAALAALEDLWPRLWAAARAANPSAAPTASPAPRAPLPALRALLPRLPAYLCALLCALSFVQGTKQTGYADTFYRYSRDVMEDELQLLDNGFQARYGLLMDVAARVPEDAKILITREGYQYALRSRGYVLTANPIVPLLNLPLEEIGPALREMNVAALATEPKFWDERYYAKSTLSEYLRTLPPDRVLETEGMRVYWLAE